MSDQGSERATSPGPDRDIGLGLTQVSQSNYVLPAVPIENVIEHLENGKLLTEIAPIYGVTPQAVGKYIRTKLGRDAYAAIRETGTEVRLHKSREAISTADDQVSLARAREEFAADKWFAEREHPERWGQRPTSQVNVSGQGVTVQLVQFGVADTPHDAAHTVDNDDIADTQDSK